MCPENHDLEVVDLCRHKCVHCVLVVHHLDAIYGNNSKHYWQVGHQRVTVCWMSKTSIFCKPCISGTWLAMKALWSEPLNIWLCISVSDFVSNARKACKDSSVYNTGRSTCSEKTWGPIGLSWSGLGHQIVGVMSGSGGDLAEAMNILPSMP